MAEDSTAFLESLGQTAGEDFLRSLAERVLRQIWSTVFPCQSCLDNGGRSYGGSGSLLIRPTGRLWVERTDPQSNPRK